MEEERNACTCLGTHTQEFENGRFRWKGRIGSCFCFKFVYQIHTASTPSTSGTHTDGGAVMRRTGIAEECHY